MNIAWAERPTEVANLLNPAFTGAALRMAVSGYLREANVGMPFELAFLVFPIALHEATRSRLPINWLEDYSNLVLACSACNGFKNQYKLPEEMLLPQSLDEFFDLRDQVFRWRVPLINECRKAENEFFQTEPWK